MFKYLGNIETDIGTVDFSINDYGFFEIRTAKKYYAVYENELVETDSKIFYKLPDRDFHISSEGVFSEIEIPADIIEDMETALAEFQLTEKSLGVTETAHGQIYFTITDDGKILCKMEDRATKTDRFFTIEGKKAVYVPDLGLDFDFIEVSSEVGNKFIEFKLDQERKDLHLVYAGRSLFTGLDYYDFNIEVSNNTWNRVKDVFEWFGEGNDGGLEGWLTSTPRLVEEYLRLRKNTVTERAEEIEKQKAHEGKRQAAIIKKLTA